MFTEKLFSLEACRARSKACADVVKKKWRGLRFLPDAHAASSVQECKICGDDERLKIVGQQGKGGTIPTDFCCTHAHTRPLHRL